MRLARTQPVSFIFYCCVTPGFNLFDGEAFRVASRGRSTFTAEALMHGHGLSLRKASTPWTPGGNKTVLFAGGKQLGCPPE